MLRIALVAAALFSAPAALACGDANCGENCPMKHAAAAPADDVDAARGTKVVFDVTGMKCGMCSGKITAALKALDGVTAVAVDHEAKNARVAYDPAKLDVAKLIAAIGAAGHYVATETQAENG